MSLFDLNDKTIAITGGYGHLGKAMTLALLDAGASVHVLGRSHEKFEEAFGKRASEVGFIFCDLNDTPSILNASKVLDSKIGKLDVLINNAISAPHWSGELKSESSFSRLWADALQGGLISVTTLTESLLPLLRGSGNGSIINIGSMYGMVAPDFRIYTEHQIPSPDYYAATKGALIQWTRYLAVKVASDGIRVNCVSPGPFPKPSVQRDTMFCENLKSRVPMGRLGEPKDLNGIITFLAGDSASYITGQNIAVDGGWTAW